jgi:hypothetical protein
MHSNHSIKIMTTMDLRDKAKGPGLFPFLADLPG